MATSKITFYRSEITPERNAIIDDIQSYLAEKCTKTYEADNFQYQKLALNQEVTIAVEQEKLGDQSLGNYADILQDNKHFYYFVVNAEWKSTKAISFVLSMDTLNTFRDELKFTSQTTIQREHVDRFRDIREDDFEYEPHIGEHDTIRLIDRQVEGLPTVKVLDTNERIKDNALDDLNWYLIYKTRDDLSKENIANPISCLLVADKPLLLAKGFVDLPKQVYNNPNFMEPGKYYFLDWQNNPNYKIGIGEGGAGSKDTLIFVLTIKDGKIALGNRSYKKIGGSYSLMDTSPINVINTPNRVTFYQSNKLMVSNYPLENYTDIVNLQNFLPMQTGTLEDKKTIPFKEVDKTDSKLMKIIRLPYCPIEITKDSNGIYHYPDNWEFKNGYLVLKSYNLSEEFLNNINKIVLDEYLKAKINVSPKDAVSATNESKFYSSEFFDYKLVYDSFVLPVRLEDFQFTSSWADSYTKPIEIGVKFKATNTVNSNFAFKLDTSITDEVNYLNRNDYENFMIVKRNNEETIFSNDYINYIRNGINYDRKAREMAIGQGVAGIFTGGIQASTLMGMNRQQAIRDATDDFYSSGANIGKGAKKVVHDASSAAAYKEGWIHDRLKQKSGNWSGLSSVAAISAGFNAVNGIFSTIMSAANAQNAIEAKKAQYASQATNVQGSDDVDLLGFYNGNRLELKTYTLEDYNKRALLDLFHYAGYSHKFREVPDLKSRYWFNYVQCTPIFDNENTSVYTSYLDDIKARFENGVTVYHHHPEIDTGWDMDQKYENWEVRLLGTENLPTTKSVLNANNFVYTDGRPFPKMTFNITVPLNTDCESFEFKYLDFGKREHYVSTKTNSVNLMAYDKTSPVYVRRKNFLNEPLSSDWTRIYK